MNKTDSVPIILASTSPYRKELLSKLGLPFTVQKPVCDEDAFKAKIRDPIELAVTLARTKAESLANYENCVIGGDQLVALGPKILGKPGTIEKAYEQLEMMQGNTHRLITAVWTIYKGQPYPCLDISEIEMRELSREQIEAYVRKDLPLDCAGSYKMEKSGLTLVSKMKCQDFSAIQGLPLIQITKILDEIGYSVPGNWTDPA